jgi:hypothetical protein
MNIDLELLRPHTLEEVTGMIKSQNNNKKVFKNFPGDVSLPQEEIAKIRFEYLNKRRS